MDLKQSIKGNVAILSISVKMMGDTESQQLHEKVKIILEKGVTNIVLDLNNVRLINSIGIGLIMACWSSVEKAGGQLKLANVGEKVYDVLTITELDQFFENYDSVETALTSFSSY